MHLRGFGNSQSQQTVVCPARSRVLDFYCLTLTTNETRSLTLMATKKGSVLKAFITAVVCVIMIGLGWLSDPLTANDQTAVLSRLLAWFCVAAAAIAFIVAIYFTIRAFTIREPPKESDLESEGDGINENPGPNHLSNH
jgi:anaerobic C4-dicarboxylate transporter